MIDTLLKTTIHTIGAVRFMKAFAHLERREGYYANVRGDRGGETYLGIARNFWQNDPLGKEIWQFIDAYKVEIRPERLKRNYQIVDEGLKAMICHFYYQKFWKPNGCDLLGCEAIALLLFDAVVHSGSKADQWLQEAINEVGGPPRGSILIKVDRQIGPKTIRAANLCDNYRLFEAFRHRRRNYLVWLADNVAGQAKFRRGWLRRIDEFTFDSHA